MAKEGQALAINDEAHQKMLAYLETTRHPVRDKAVYLLTYRAGMRIGSVAGLMLDDVIDAQGALRQVVILRKKIQREARPSLLTSTIQNCRKRSRIGLNAGKTSHTRHCSSLKKAVSFPRIVLRK